MSHLKPFWTQEETQECIYRLSEDEEHIGIFQLPAEECGCLTDEEGINEDTFENFLLPDICGKI